MGKDFIVLSAKGRMRQYSFMAKHTHLRYVFFYRVNDDDIEKEIHRQKDDCVKYGKGKKQYEDTVSFLMEYKEREMRIDPMWRLHDKTEKEIDDSIQFLDEMIEFIEIRKEYLRQTRREL